MISNVVFCKGQVEREAAVSIYKSKGRPAFWFGPFAVGSAERFVSKAINQEFDVGPDCYVVIAPQPGDSPVSE